MNFSWVLNPKSKLLNIYTQLTTSPFRSHFFWTQFERHARFVKIGTVLFLRNLWQSRYLLFNWVYTTNHKRISINYFWFVLFAGVVGMVLATIIRLELAYPGIGILAGDNSQYLSIVTAHGVIMVFFMAIPLLFGFLGNFLLPTQMGVHDVAFPRMNSAAFWFLPASLLALCQLVCIDRRYQRMNCFNIKEVQSLLRNKFIHETSYNRSILSSDNGIISSLGTITNRSTFPQTKHSLQSNYNPLSLNLQSTFRFSNLIHPTPSNPSYTNPTLTPSLYTPIAGILRRFIYSSVHLLNYKTLILFYKSSSTQNPLPLFINDRGGILIDLPLNINVFKFFHPDNLTTVLNGNTTLNLQINRSGNFYSEKFSFLDHPTVLYKIKTGNYLPDELFKVNYYPLFNTINFKTMLKQVKGIWFESNSFALDLHSRFTNTGKFAYNKTSALDVLNSMSKSLSVRDGFLVGSTYINLLSSMNVDLENLILNQTKQARILNNWRFLKLQREGWRCRMLSARHQRSMYRRYVNENEVIWVVEKNAKDLLPGWAMVTPFSSRTRYTLIGKTDIGISIVAITLMASMISSANFLMTYRYLSTLNNRKMRDARSFFSESVIAASWMMIAANPMLILGLFMLLSDRHWRTCFFDYSGGGDTVLFQHMFWFFGHPEVYIIILPCFGITNTLLSFYLRKRISARASLLYSLYTIAFLGFFVWGHHMYMVGLSHTTRMLYSTLTVMISVPAATKIMHWLVTLVNSTIHFELPFILTLLFVFYFVSGGISGMAVAHTGMNILFHDTFYVIGHFHVMLAGSLMFSAYSAVYFYLPSLFGVRYSRFFAYLHVYYYSIGQIFTVIPMMWLGYSGMPRRVLDYPSAMGGWHSIISSAHIITVSGVLTFVIMLFDSLRKQRSYTIKTFGVGRYNTRLNFYLYQIARNRYWVSKHLTLLPVRATWHVKSVSNNEVMNLEYMETTLFYFSFSKRPVTSTWLY